MTDIPYRLQLKIDTQVNLAAAQYEGMPGISSTALYAFAWYAGGAWRYAAPGDTSGNVKANAVYSNFTDLRINPAGQAFFTQLQVSNLTNTKIPRVSSASGLFTDSAIGDDGTNVTITRPLTLNGATRPAWAGVFDATQESNLVGTAVQKSSSTRHVASRTNGIYWDGTQFKAIATSTDSWPAILSLGYDALWYATDTENPTAGSTVTLSTKWTVDKYGQSKQWSSELVTSGRWSKTSTTTIANTITETSLWGGAQSIPANRIQSVGQIISIKAAGRVSCLNSAGYTIKVNVGSTIIGTGTGSFPAALSGQAFRVEGDLTFWTVGASGGVMGYVMFHFTTSGGQAQPYVIPVVLSSSTTAWDTTTEQNLDITMTWGAANASNSISCDHGKIVIT